MTLKSKFYFNLIPLFTLCSLSIFSLAQTPSSELAGPTSTAGNGTESGCKNPSKYKGCGKCNVNTGVVEPVAIVPEEAYCPTGTESTASLIINNGFEFLTKAYDYVTPAAASSCGSCSGGGASSTLPSLAVTRLIRPRYNEFALNELWGSFGNGQYWSEIDRSIFINDSGVIRIRDPRQSDKQIFASFDSARGGWADLGDESFVSLNLIDDSGNIITNASNKRDARYAIANHHNGSKDIYEVFWRRLSESGIGNAWTHGFGRLIAVVDRNTNALTIQYERAIEANGIIGLDTMTDAEKLDLFQKTWKRSSVTDAYNKQISIQNAYNSALKRYFVSKLTFPNGQQITYTYKNLATSKGSLHKVTHPDGSVSARYAGGFGPGLIRFILSDSAAVPSDQKKHYYVTKSVGTTPTGGYVSQVPNLIRAVVNGAGEIRYANREYKDPITDVISSYIYEGGKRVVTGKYIDAGGPTNLSYITSPEAGNGFYSSDISTWQKLSIANSTNYDSRGYGTGATDALGRTASVSYSQLSNTPLAGVSADGSSSSAILGIYNQPTVVVDKLGRITLHSYSPTGNLKTITTGLSSANLANAQQLLAAGDIVGLRQLAPTTQHIYNSRGQIYETRDPLYQTNKQSLHNTRYNYDANGYLIKKILSKDAPSAQPRPVITYTYDATGRLATSTDPLGRVATFAYDNRNRLISSTYNDTSTQLVEYGTPNTPTSNLVVSTTDRNGIKTLYTYDNAARRTKSQITNHLSQVIGETNYTYLAGTSKPLTVTTNGDTTTYSYDFANRRISTSVQANANTALATTSEYDQLDRLRSSTDAYGRSTYYLYDQNDRPIKSVAETVPDGIKPASGNIPDIVAGSTQTSSAHNYTLTDLANNTLETDPNNLGHTHKVTYTDPRDLYLDGLARDLTPNAKYLITETVYDAEGQALIRIDARGNSSWTEYDTLGRTTLTIAAVGTPSEIRSEQDYDLASNMVESRSPRYFTEGDGSVGVPPASAMGIGKDLYTYNARNMRASHTTAPGSAEEATQSWTYLLDGRSDEHTDFRGNIAKSLWHACCGRLQASIQRDGTSTSIHNTDYKGQATHTAVVSANPNGNWHDPVNANTLRETTTRFDGRGRPTHSSVWLTPLGTVDDDARISLGDAQGIPIAGLDGIPATDGLTTTYEYDEDLTDGIGIDADYSTQLTELTTRYGYNPFAAGTNGYAVAVTNPAGETSVQISDGAGRTIMSINPEGDLSTYHYDEIIAVTEMLPNSQTLSLLKTKSIDALGNENASYTDAAGRTLATEDALGNYSIASYNANSSVITTRDANGLGQTCAYDALNRPTTCADLQETAEGKNRTTTYNAASQPLVSTNADGETSTNVYDVRGRLSTNTDGNAIVTTYTYDANNNLLTLTDGKGDTRSWTYDARNLNTSKTYPGFGDILSYTHDALGRILTKTDQQSDTTENTYDLAGRLTTRVYKDGSVGVPPASTPAESTDSFTYDEASRILTTTKGRHNITTEHTYALDGLPLTEKLVADNRTYLSTRTYDAANRPLTHTYPSGETTHWAYDARNIVTTVHYEDKIVVTNTYDDGYRLTDQSFGNGLNRTINYDRNDNLRSSDILADGTQGIDDLTMVYNYAADKQITAEQIAGDLLPSSGFTSSYDNGNRLTAWTRDGSVGVPPASATSTNNPSAQTWNYDNAGNWNSTSRTINNNTTAQARTHSAADQINTIAGNAATHDLKGNLTEYEINGKEYTVTYDLDNRIITVDVDNDDVEYRYDAFGRRVIRKEGSTNTSLIWWGNSECAEHKHQAGTTVIQNDIMEHPSRLNSVIARAVDGSKFKLQWYHKNYLDHVYAVSDDSGDILEHYRYSAFGEVTIYDQNGQLQNTTQIDNHILWNTRRRDEVSGFYLYKYRHYSAELGRWPSRDPIEESGGVNLYAFVANNSLSRIDFLGLYSLTDADRAIGEAIAAAAVAASRGEGPWPSFTYTESDVFDKWLELEKNDDSWLANIPECPSRICVIDGKPKNCNNGDWGELDSGHLVNKYHPGADYCMRSVDKEGSAQQCCYELSEDGEWLILIKDGEAAGTPDRIAAEGILDAIAGYNGDTNHYGHDVRTFERAKKLGRISDYLTVRPPSQGGGKCYAE